MDDLSGILLIYLIVVLVWLLVASFTLISILKRKDMMLPVKILWSAVVVIVPVVGLIIYLIYNYNKENRV